MLINRPAIASLHGYVEPQQSPFIRVLVMAHHNHVPVKTFPLQTALLQSEGIWGELQSGLNCSVVLQMWQA